ncbi:hypothetical protein KL950_000617 [Ogataea haglerorum]|nr:hypothetical protein KL915_004240 [Ogataea haglerorum]KAG7712746.1 hypothetical protein KL950_000617 [Ogataea haglerorum]KAG7815065.1 hypothetical protein KL924_000151 [Ogataea haglerorum]
MQPESNGVRRFTGFAEPHWECSSFEKENGREHASSEAETRLDNSVRDDHIPLGVDQGRGWRGGSDFGHLRVSTVGWGLRGQATSGSGSMQSGRRRRKTIMKVCCVEQRLGSVALERQINGGGAESIIVYFFPWFRHIR